MTPYRSPTGRRQAAHQALAERTATWRRGRRVLLRVSRAAWRLDQAGRERSWALASARTEGMSIRALAAAAGLSSSRVRQIAAAAGLDELDAALGELRAAGVPAPEDPLAMMTRNWTAGTPPQTGSAMRRAGCGSAQAG